MVGKHFDWRMVRGCTLFLIAALLVVVSGCRQFRKPWVPAPLCPRVVSFNFDQCPDREKCSDAEKCNLIRRLAEYDVQIIRVGEEMKIVLSSDRVFHPKSANFDERYLCVVAHLATLLWCYRKEDMTIEGFTDCYGDADHNRALSLLQAQRVAKYLWARGINTRLVHSKGHGPAYPIANQATYYQRSRNRRIEITFRDLPDTK